VNVSRPSVAWDTNSGFESRPRRRAGLQTRVSIRNLLIAAFLFSGLIPLLMVSVVGMNTVRTQLKQQMFRHLESIRELKAVQIRQFFAERETDIAILSRSPRVIRACAELTRAFYATPPPLHQRFHGSSEGGFTAPEAYRRIHDRHFPYLKHWADLHQYYDIFLLDPQRGDVVFSVRKEADFGGRLGKGDSPLADAWSQARGGVTALSDTRPYMPSGNRPAQFLAAPVIQAGRVTGVVAVQISNAAVAAIMSERSGMWPTGETYLVGPDLKMRSDSFMSPESHSLLASFFGNVKENGVDTMPAQRGLRGVRGVGETRNYDGIDVISAYAPLRIKGLSWVIIAEVRSSEIRSIIAAALNTRVLPLIIGALAALAALALAVSLWIGRSIRRVSGQIETMINQALEGDFNMRGDVRKVGPDFRPVVDGVNRLLDTFCREAEERRLLEQHMQYTQRMMAIGSLAGGIAHDFNNLLATLFVNLEIIRNELPVDSRARVRLPEIRAALRRGAGLVHQILTFSHPGERPSVHVQLKQVVREALDMLRAITPRNVRMEASNVTANAWVKADPTQIHQILVNLCSNASQAIGSKGGRVDVRVDRIHITAGRFRDLEAGQYCRIRVSDTGPGISPKLRQHIFEPFFTTRSSSGGTGLGLSVVQGIVMGLGGRIYLSARKTKGATFEVLLPAVEPPALEWKTEAGKESQIQTEAPARRILFVDDEAGMAGGVARMLAPHGFQVVFRSDPRAAERIFSRNPGEFDAVVADLDMPHIDGIELLGRCRRLRPELPCLLITGHTGKISSRRLAAIPGMAFLRKPFEKQALLDTLEGLLGKDNE